MKITTKKLLFIFCTILLVITFSGCSKTPEENKINEANRTEIDAQTKAQEEAIASLTKPNDKSKDSTTQNNEDKPWCDWINESEIIIRLDLPEEYKNGDSYATGFAHLDNDYNSVQHTGRLAREKCDYRVGFNKEDFINFWGIQIPYSEAGLGFYFDYEGKPLQMNLKDGLPDYDGEIVLKVIGKVSVADDETHSVLKGQ